MYSVWFDCKECSRTRIYGHLRWPFFSLFRYGKLLELVSICNSLNDLEVQCNPDLVTSYLVTNPDLVTILQKTIFLLHKNISFSDNLVFSAPSI